MNKVFKKINKISWGLVLVGLTLSLSSCGSSSTDIDSGFSENAIRGVQGQPVKGLAHLFRGAGVIQDSRYLIGGPVAQGQVGDILMQNEHVRFIIQKPNKKNTGVNSFGGNIIDADLTRGPGEAGQDNFAALFPALNIAWTSNAQGIEIVQSDFGPGAESEILVRTDGKIDTYEYVQASIIRPLALANTPPAKLHFDTRFDDLYDPFTNYPALKAVSNRVMTEYKLKRDSKYIEIKTYLYNSGDSAVPFPLGDWLNTSGSLETFVPKKGFYSSLLMNDVPALVMTALENNQGVSYAYAYDLDRITNDDGSLRQTDALNIGGVIPVFPGDEFLDMVPLEQPDGSERALEKIDAALLPGMNVFTRYFSVGTGDAASAMEPVLSLLDINTMNVSGTVVDGQGQTISKARLVMGKYSQMMIRPGVFRETFVPITMALSNANGQFKAQVPVPVDAEDFRTKYFSEHDSFDVRVYKEGYFAGAPNGIPVAGACGAGQVVDNSMTNVVCTLGESGLVRVNVTEGSDDNETTIPARITIVGLDPTPIHPHLSEVTEDVGDIAYYTDPKTNQRPYGIVDVLFAGHKQVAGQQLIYPKGNPRVAEHAGPNLGGRAFRLEPGSYRIYVTRGLEYSVHQQVIRIQNGDDKTVNANLKHVLKTPGYVSADLHLHSIGSSDSPFGVESRARNALAEGMDILLSTDHDFVTDYRPVVQRIDAAGLIFPMAGDEITPLAYGHLLTFPLLPDPNHISGGAYDYTEVPGDIIGFAHDYVQSPAQIIAGVGATNPGTQVFQMAHIMDKALGNFAISGLVTSTKFLDAEPFSTWADPINFRLRPNTNDGVKPFPLGTSDLITLDFTALELVIGEYHDALEHLEDIALPTAFNLFNLGVKTTITGSSDSHYSVKEPIGLPRNYIRSPVDPRDNPAQDFANISQEDIAVNTNNHQLTVSSGPFVTAQVVHANGGQVGLGGTLDGSSTQGQVTLQINIKSIEHINWDTVDVYINTDPMPANDNKEPLAVNDEGKIESSSEDFYLGKIKNEMESRKYVMEPQHHLVLSDGDFRQSLRNGLRSANISLDLELNEDSWIVVVVKETQTRTMFPFVTENLDQANLSQLDFQAWVESGATHPPVNSSVIEAFAFTNPIFVDVDGNGFQAKYVRSGESPLADSVVE